MKQVLLVDGHSLIYRSFFAFIRRPLRNALGMNTSAVFGFANTLRKLLRDLKPGYCAVVYDAPGKTFRHEKFKEYKIQRPPAPDEMVEQIPVIKEMVTAWGLASFEVAGVEADDVLGTLAQRFAKQSFEVTVATSDKDMLQLIGDSITVYDPWKGKRYRPRDVLEKLGVDPKQVPDYLALAGDSVDNVPGVPGIGPKRACEILKRHGSLATALKKEKCLRGHESVAKLSRELTEIDTSVEIDAVPEGLRIRECDRKRLGRVFEVMGFETLLRELGPEAPEPVTVVEFKGDFRLETAGKFAFCYRPGAGLWFSHDGKQTVFIPEKDRVHIKQLLEEPKLVKVGYNIKQQVKLLHQAGLKLKPPVFDVSVGAWLVDTSRRRYQLEDLMVQVLGRPVRAAGPDGEPAQVLQLFQALEPQVAAMDLEPVADELEMPLVFVLAEMEELGIKVDIDYLANLEQELARELGNIRQKIWQLAGVEFNIGSPKQLGNVLFERLKLPKGRRTKTGFSTNSAVLTELVSLHPVVQEVLHYRELTKLCNTYIRPLLESANERTHRIHAEFNQTGTSTGRLSSSNPNLQNIPVRTELGRKIRNAFVAEQGKVLISADYSQIELRVLAHVTGDDELKQAFFRGEDVHAQTAAAILGLKPEDITPEHRRMAKVVNYGLIYGMSDFGLSSRMGISLEEARSFLKGYMGRFAGVAEWRERIVRQAQENGFVRTIAGRMRPLPGIISHNHNIAEAAKRAALNSPIQGSAADIIKRAMLNLAESFHERGINGGMVVQVHDELVSEVDSKQVEEAHDIIKEEMEGAWKLAVPLVVDIGMGHSWAEAH